MPSSHDENYSGFRLQPSTRDEFVPLPNLISINDGHGLLCVFDGIVDDKQRELFAGKSPDSGPPTPAAR